MYDSAEKHNVVILAPVHIEELQPSDPQIVVYDDKDFELSCTVSGSNIKNVKWYKGDQPLDDQYFQIWDLQTLKGQYEYQQTQAVKSVVVRKPDSKLLEWCNSCLCRLHI